MDPLELGHQRANGLGPRRDLHSGQFFHALTVGQGVDMGADATHPLQQVEILYPRALLRRLFYAAMRIAQPCRGTGDDLAIDRELEMPRLLQSRMLRADGDDKSVLFRAILV